MTLVLVMVFNILVAFVLGFVFGRIYQIRRAELERRDGFALPPTAHRPHPASLALLWQIYSCRVLAQIHLWQCGHR